MNNNNFLFQIIAWTLAFSLAFGLLIGVIVIATLPFWLLWNWLIPTIFGLPKISILQAFGLWLMIVLVKSTRFDYSKTFGDTKQMIDETKLDDIQWEDLLVSVRKNYRA